MRIVSSYRPPAARSARRLLAASFLLASLLLSAALLAGCASLPEADSPAPAAPPDPAAAVHWRDVDPAHLLLLQLPSGEVLIELAPWMAPRHTAQMQRLAREGHYADSAAFYRVIDGFVAQGGVVRPDSAGGISYDHPDLEALPAEFERPLAALPAELPYVPLGEPDLYAPETGHIGGFAVGHDPEAGTVWPLHCYGAVAMARDPAPDTGTGHFYIVIGRDQRYLDRNLTVFGRVLHGMEHVQRVNRGDRAVQSGVIPDAATRTPILDLRLAADLPAEARPRLQVMRAESPAFAAEKERRRYRGSDFFVVPPPAVEACAVPGPVRTPPEGTASN